MGKVLGKGQVGQISLLSSDISLSVWVSYGLAWEEHCQVSAEPCHHFFLITCPHAIHDDTTLYTNRKCHLH